MQRLIRWLAVLLVVLLHGAAAMAQELERAVLELVVNGSNSGEVFVLLRDGDVLVPLKSLRDAGLVRLDVTTEEHEGVEHVSLRTASPPLAFEFDDRALTVSVFAPPSVLALATVDLANRPPADVRYESSPSAYFNYAPRLVDGTGFQAFGEVGASLGPALAETSATYSDYGGATRLASRVTFDDRKHLRSAIIGDSFVSAGPLGGALVIGGLSFVRNYELDPYLVKIPRLGYTGRAMSPSTVDVYVNDVLVRRVPVEPGEFELTNVTPVSGAGTTRYVIRDAYGREQRLESTYYASSSVLAEGFSEYSYGLGLVRDGFGTKSFSYGQPAFVGRHRFGVSNHVTSGFHGEFARSGGTAGSDVTVSTSLGELEFHTAGSVTTGDMPQRGVAGIVGYGYHGRRSSLRTVLRGTTRHFSTLSLEPEHDRNLVEQVTSTSHVVGSSTSLNTEIAFSLLRDGGPSSRYRAALNRRVTNQLTLQFVGSSSFDTSLWEHNLFVTMSWSLPAQHNAELTERFGTRVSNVTARVSRSMQETTDVGYQLSGSTGQMRHATANVHGQAPFGRMSATYTNFEGEAHTILEASGSVVFIGGRPYLSRPVTQSFALLEVPGAADVRGYLNNREVGRTGADGRLFVPELLPYQANKLRVEQSDLPLDYTLTEEEIVVAPPNRGGSVVAFPAHRIRLLRGRIVRQVGSGMMPIAYGTLTVPTREGVLSSPLGQAGEFEIEGLQPGQWRGTVSRGRRACEVTLHVPSGGEGPVQQLGVIRCSGRAGAAP